MTIFEHLQAYAPTMLPMHMPGGKRRFASALPYHLDVTEVEGMDNLHDAQGILAQAQRRAAALFGAEESFFLVNGSTGGLLSAVRATGDGGLLLARNCHRAVYHAAELCRRDCAFVLPARCGHLAGSVSPEAVRQALEMHRDVTTVVITSPTYEGVVSDIASIAQVCHERGVVLIVDEAHGAHFGLHPVFPSGAVACGADIVVQSLHKTLPALTQTAILHSRAEFAPALRRENAVFETSSPSYLLLASADECVHFLASETGRAQMDVYVQALLAVRQRLRAGLQRIRLLDGTDGGIFAYDPSKLVLLTDGTDTTGVQLAEQLRREFAIETEMALPGSLTAMTSVCDRAKDLNRFADAVLALDQRQSAGQSSGWHPASDKGHLDLPEPVFQPYAVRGKAGTVCPLPQSVGRVSLEAIWAYPPGIPLLLPGERVPDTFPHLVEKYRRAGVLLHSTLGTLDEQAALTVLADG